MQRLIIKEGCRNGYLDLDSLFLFDKFTALFFAIDLGTWKCRYINIPLGKIRDFQPRKFIRYARGTFVVSCTTADIVEISSMEKEPVNYYTPGEKQKSDRNIEPLVWGDEIWLISRSLAYPLYIFNMKNRTYRKCAGWGEKIRNVVGDGGIHPISSAQRLGTKLWMIYEGTDKVLSYDIDDDTVRQYEFGKHRRLLSMICREDDFFIISEDDDTLMRWNPETGRKEYISLEGGTDEGHLYTRLILADDDIFILPDRSENIIRYRKNHTRDYIPAPKILKDVYPMCGHVCWRNRLLLLPWGSDTLVEVDLESDIAAEHRLTADGEKMILLNERSVVWEKGRKDLKFYSESVMGHRLLSRTGYTRGGEIYKNIKGTCM